MSNSIIGNRLHYWTNIVPNRIQTRERKRERVSYWISIMGFVCLCVSVAQHSTKNFLKSTFQIVSFRVRHFPLILSLPFKCILMDSRAKILNVSYGNIRHTKRHEWRCSVFFRITVSNTLWLRCGVCLCLCLCVIVVIVLVFVCRLQNFSLLKYSPKRQTS